MIRILFICHGNICRSPTAEFYMKELVRRAGLESEFEIASAAAHRDELGSPVYPPARALLSRHGIDCSEKRARLMTREDYGHYDLLIGMDEENLRDMRRLFGADSAGKLHCMMDFAGRPGVPVADPWYTGDFERTWRDVARGCQGLLQSLRGIVTVDFSACRSREELYAELREKLYVRDWYGENLDALYDVLTGLEHKEGPYLILPPESGDEGLCAYAGRIAAVFDEAGC